MEGAAQLKHYTLISKPIHISVFFEKTKRNTQRVRRQLSAKAKTDPAIVYSAAKYYEALNKLAQN
jgi:hypothetical protein